MSSSGVPGARRRLRCALAASLVVVCALVLAGCSHGESIKPPKPPTDQRARLDAGAQQTLTALAGAIADRRAEAAAASGSGSARTLLAAAARNAAALDLRDVSLRYVGEDGDGLTADEQQRFGAEAWLGTVDVGYRIPRFDPGPTRIEVAVVLVPTAAGVRVAAVGAHGKRAPSWLWGPLRVLDGPRTLVVCGDAGNAAAYGRYAARAVREVDRVLPDWRGRLVIEVPPDEATLDAALGAEQKQYAAIAAVTTTVDGTREADSAVHVFVNPRVFATLEPTGAQVVLTHEATHVATKASSASSTLPEWLLEGFADYVALAHAGVPVGVAARQFVAKMRKHGLPGRLPTSADLQPTASGLGATYEEAWTANRSLALHYGEQRLVRLYRAVSAGRRLDQALRTVLHTTRARFVRQWRDDLRQLLGSG